MDITPTTLSRWLNDKDRPHPRRIDMIAKWLDRPVSEVLEAIYTGRNGDEVPTEVVEMLNDLTVEVRQLRDEVAKLRRGDS